MKNNMSDSSLYQMSKIAFDLSNKLVPYSSNNPNLDRKSWQPHRKLVHYAANARKDKNNDKGKIKDLHLFIGNPKAELDFNSYIVSGEYFNTKNPSIEKLIEIIDGLPQHSDKKNHKPKDDYPFLLIHYPRNKKLTIKDLNEFLDDQQYSNGDMCTTPLIIKKNNRYFIYGQTDEEGNWAVNSLPRELCFALPFPKQSPFNELQGIYYDPLLSHTIEKHLPLYHEIEKNNFHQLGRELDEFEFTQRIAKNAIDFGIGNCGERSAVAFILLKEKKLIEKHFPELLKEDIRLERMCLVSNYELGKQSDNDRQGGKFYLEVTADGLQYEIIGSKGKLIKGTIGFDKFPSDIPHELSKILALNDELQKKLINILLKNATDQDKNLPTYSGDHSFVVVNRDVASNLHDLSTWGDQCLIVDAWMGNIISPAKQSSLLTGNHNPHCYHYISSHAMCINLLDETTIGADYTLHWLRSRQLKNKNINLSDTKPAYTTNNKVDLGAQSSRVQSMHDFIPVRSILTETIRSSDNESINELAKLLQNSEMHFEGDCIGGKCIRIQCPELSFEQMNEVGALFKKSISAGLWLGIGINDGINIGVSHKRDAAKLESLFNLIQTKVSLVRSTSSETRPNSVYQNNPFTCFAPIRSVPTETIRSSDNESIKELATLLRNSEMHFEGDCTGGKCIRIQCPELSFEQMDEVGKLFKKSMSAKLWLGIGFNDGMNIGVSHKRDVMELEQLFHLIQLQISPAPRGLR